MSNSNPVVRDSRLEAFVSPKAPEVFHSICHRHEIFLDDPLDVEDIHQEARDTFERILHRATTPPGLHSGRILLLKGESGSGKTHLMRAFRRTTHTSGLGYFGYMQMTTGTDNYAEYILGNLVSSLDMPYQANGLSGLLRLSNSLFEHEDIPHPEVLARIREDESLQEGLPHLVYQLAGQVLKCPRLSSLDLDLVRALLFLQRGDPMLKGRVLAWLRCEDLSNHDRDLLGGLVPRTRPYEALKMIEALARTMWVAHGGVLVLCLDQLEDMVLEQAKERFQRAMSCICAIGDQVPSSIVVISCLEDFYLGLRAQLSASARDRMENDPAPITLVGGRSQGEIKALIRTRLEFLYEAMDTPFYPKNPLYPFEPDQLALWENQRTRDILESCRALQRKLANGDAIPVLAQGGKGVVDVQPEIIKLEQAWNDHLASWKERVADDEESLATLLAETINNCSAELESGHRFRASAQGRLVEVDTLGRGLRLLATALLGICNGASQGGTLERQVQQLQSKAGKRTCVAVRGTAFPSNPKTKIAATLGAVVASGGRRVVIGPSDWRAMLAMRAFRTKHQGNAAFLAWVGEENPTSRLHGIREALALDRLPPLSQAEPVAPAVQAGSPTNVAPAASAQTVAPLPAAKGPVAGIWVGRGRDVFARDLYLDPQDLTRHAAFLGGSGSGKTTLAMHIIEELLQRGIPAILLDRKGDLCSYAQEAAWSAAARDEPHARQRQALRNKLDLAVYTPGNPTGRPLAIPLAPKDLAAMATHERDQAMTYSAFALGNMLGYDAEKRGKPAVAVLKQAIAVLAGLGQDINLASLLQIIGDPPPAFLNTLGLIDTKVLKNLGQQLQTLLLTGGPLVGANGPALDVDALLGRGTDAVDGKTRLSIINTKFLGDTTNVLFFVSQLLISLARWTSKNPAAQLQAVLFTDEADLYLPASSKPPTKEPMENLLKRARSAGLSVMLATQSPGDLDYRCRDTIYSWFVGRVKEATALSKMKPMLSEAKGNILGKIPAQSTGEFHLLRDGSATAFKGERSLVDLEQLSEDEILVSAAGR